MMTPAEEDIAFAVQDLEGVAEVLALGPGDGPYDYVVSLKPYRMRLVAAVHYRIREAVGAEVAARVWYRDAETKPPAFVLRASPLVLDEAARVAAASRADARRSRPQQEELDALGDPAASEPHVPGSPRWFVLLGDARAVELLEEVGAELVIAHDPRRLVAERVSVAEARTQGPFSLAVVDRYEILGEAGALRDVPALVFRPTGFAPSPVIHTYEELRSRALLIYKRPKPAPAPTSRAPGRPRGSRR